MNTQSQLSGLQLRSLVKKSGEMELSLIAAAVPKPGTDEVLVRIDAAPINPSDLGLLLSAADWSQPKVSQGELGPVVSTTVSPGAVRAMAARVDQSMPVGNEGAGVVVEAGSSAEAWRKAATRAEIGLGRRHRAIRAGPPSGTGAVLLR